MIALNVLRGPSITEKSMAKTASGRYTFEVAPHVTKGQIKQAVEETFGVKVLGVKTLKVAGKTHRVGRFRRKVITNIRKKAIVQLKEGQKIEVFETKS